jgi:hypothetical protein
MFPEASMTTRQLCICLSFIGLCWLLPVQAIPAPSAPVVAARAATPAQQAGRYGPYATMRRANEVAAWFRQQGFQAVAFHNGDGYYVDVR